ncbi:MAG: hypothetical protein AABZ30_05465 [Myxococcota bacterium]
MHPGPPRTAWFGPAVWGPALVAGVLWSATGAQPALANTGEVFGLGSRSAAQAGAVAASAADFSACYYNPAGLVFAHRPELTLGASWFHSRLAIEGRPREIENPFGILIGGVQPLPLGGVLQNRISTGIALFLLPDRLVRVIARRPEEAFFPLYDNRTQRLVVLPALALRLHPRVAVGAAANVLARLDGHVVAREGSARALEPRVDEQIRTTAKLHAGLRVRPPVPGDRLDVGVTYRQRFSVPFRTTTRNTIAGEPLDLDVEAEGLFTPHQIVGGAAYDLAPGPRVEGDLAWLFWSRYGGPYVDVDASLPLLAPVSANLPRLDYRDVWAARLGVEQPLRVRVGVLALRAGGHFEPTPVPDQPGASNQIDGDKLTLSAGVGLAIGGTRFRVDAHGLVQIVRERRLKKRLAACFETACDRENPADALVDEDLSPDNGYQISNVGYPSISGGGRIWAGGLTLTVGL